MVLQNNKYVIKSLDFYLCTLYPPQLEIEGRSPVGKNSEIQLLAGWSSEIFSRPAKRQPVPKARSLSTKVHKICHISDRLHT